MVKSLNPLFWWLNLLFALIRVRHVRAHRTFALSSRARNLSAESAKTRFLSSPFSKAWIFCLVNLWCFLNVSTRHGEWEYVCFVALKHQIQGSFAGNFQVVLGPRTLMKISRGGSARAQFFCWAMVSMMGTPIQETQGSDHWTTMSAHASKVPGGQSWRFYLGQVGWSSNIGIQHFTSMRI